MNKKYILQSNYSFKYFVKGVGFTTSCKCEASKLTQAEVTACKVAGFEPSKQIEVTASYAVNYVRPEDVTGGTVQHNSKNPSKRRFATFDEAVQHGSRFTERKADASSEPGSAGHIGFYVTESYDPVNASINWKTGMTNSL